MYIPDKLRWEAVAVYRLFTGHDCLDAHLYRFGILADAACSLHDKRNELMDRYHLQMCGTLHGKDLWGDNLSLSHECFVKSKIEICYICEFFFSYMRIHRLCNLIGSSTWLASFWTNEIWIAEIVNVNNGWLADSDE